MFHLAYLVFIFSGAILGDPPNLDLGLLVCCLAFLDLENNLRHSNALGRTQGDAPS